MLMSSGNEQFQEAKESLSSYTIDINPDSKKLFEKFIVECKESDIELVFVFAPIHKLGREFLVNLDEVLELYREYSSVYNIPFYDLSDDSTIASKDYYYNSTHLNIKGSTLFSKKLGSMLKRDLSINLGD